MICTLTSARPAYRAAFAVFFAVLDRLMPLCAGETDEPSGAAERRGEPFHSPNGILVLRNPGRIACRDANRRRSARRARHGLRRTVERSLALVAIGKKSCSARVDQSGGNRTRPTVDVFQSQRDRISILCQAQAEYTDAYLDAAYTLSQPDLESQFVEQR